VAKFVQKQRHITHVAVSDLLNSPEARLIKASARLVGDADVLHCLLSELLKKEHGYGVIIDGFPRSKVQVNDSHFIFYRCSFCCLLTHEVECLKYLHSSMMELHHEFRRSEFSQVFRRPKFHIVMLYIEEADSVERQLARGRRVREHNEIVRRTGEGFLMEGRPTDFDVVAARTRYQIFQ
jgi:adenylate kinase